MLGRQPLPIRGGMHVNAVQKVAHSFEHVEPATVGNRQRILVSELSGQSNVLMKAEELGLHVKKGSDEAKAILHNLKELEEQGYEFEAAEASFELLIRQAPQNLPNRFSNCTNTTARSDVTETETTILARQR